MQGTRATPSVTAQRPHHRQMRLFTDVAAELPPSIMPRRGLQRRRLRGPLGDYRDAITGRQSALPPHSPRIRNAATAAGLGLSALATKPCWRR